MTQDTVTLEIEEFRLRAAIKNTLATYLSRFPILTLGAVVILAPAYWALSNIPDWATSNLQADIVTIAIFIVAGAIVLTFSTVIVQLREEGWSILPSDLLRRVGGVVVTAINIYVFKLLGTAVGLVLVVIPGLLLLVRWAVVVPVVVVERTRVGTAFSRSRKLVAGKSWRVFFFVIGLTVLAGAPAALIVTETLALDVLIIGAADLILMPLVSVAVAVLYYELRGFATVPDLPPMEELVRVQNLQMHFPISSGMFRAPTDFVHAVDDISFSIKPGESLGLVGESGCGKTTTGRMIVKLASPTGGTIAMKETGKFDVLLNHAGTEPAKVADLIAGMDGMSPRDAAALVDDAPATVLRRLDEGEAQEAKSAIQAAGGTVELTTHAVDVALITGADDLRDFRGKVQMIFQDPYESMNPRRTVFDTVAEPLAVQGIGKPHEREERVAELLTRVGLTPAASFLFRYPHELSGGQRQRVAIARALVLGPSFVVADEPTSMLDVSIRISIMDLMLKLAKEFGVSYLYITHDLAVARYMCDRIAVMYLGKIVEIGETEKVLSNPQHPYTKALLSAVPVPDPSYKRPPVEIKGGINKAINPQPICRFIERCPIATDYCRGNDHPPLEDKGEGTMVACYLVEKKAPVPV